jgi:MFS family permease
MPRPAAEVRVQDTAQTAEPAGSRGFARLVAGHTLVHASMSGMRLAAPLLALHLGLGTVYVGVLLALYSLTQVVIALPVGRYVERHGMRRPLGWAALVAPTGFCPAGLPAVGADDRHPDPRRLG